MRVILLEKMINLGNFGEVIQVKDGYARNFLIPRHIARRADVKTIAEFDAKRTELEKISAEKLRIARIQGEKLNGFTVDIFAKSGVDGRLFGSVTNIDIAETLSKHGFLIKKNQVRLPQSSFKFIGDYIVLIALHTDVIVSVTIKVRDEHTK